MVTARHLAIIPARGGSKRIPRKNIRPFAGKPIIAYSIEAARRTALFREILVSTDDLEIAAVAREWGASVPFLRSAENSDDHATLAQVVCEVLEQCSAQGRTYDYSCCILPTAPLIAPADLARGYDLLSSSDLDSVVSVVRFSYPVQRALRLTESGYLEMADPRYLTTRSNDLEPRYHDAGQFYWLRVAAFLDSRRFFAPLAGALVIPENRAQDIDSEEDWAVAEAKQRYLAGK